MKKIKNKNTKKVVLKKPKIKKYPSYYLAIALAGVLLVEGIIFGSASAADWKVGASILDVSAAVSEVSSDMSLVFQPQVQFVEDINTFYQLSADQMTPMLDLSQALSDVAIVYTGVDEFYQQASVQMAKLLDVSGMVQMPRVAGISISR